MFKKLGHSALATLLGASMLIMPAEVTEVSAITIPPVQRDALIQVSPSQDGLYQEVQTRRELRRRYLRRRDGRFYPRHRYRHGPYRHYHRGYWYSTPWWLLTIPFAAAAGAAIAGSNSGSAHVRWCSNRYRSYDPRTNTWVGYSGRVYQCNSPYDGR
jgi:hypothetical protein